jgi:hypothetical protein
MQATYNANTLKNLRRIVRGGTVIVVVAESVHVILKTVAWQRGKITTRDYITSGSQAIGGMVGGAAGGWAGMELGALIGSTCGPLGSMAGGVIGGMVGGVVGGLAGGHAAGYAVDAWYARLDKKEQLELKQFVYQHYGVPLAQ